MVAPNSPSPTSSGAHADRLLADAARAADGARARLNGVLNDLFRPPEARLSDRDHAVLMRMLAALIEMIEQDIRTHLVDSGDFADNADLSAALDDQGFAIAWPRLARSRVMRDLELAAMLLRRADEHHFVLGLRYPSAAGESRMGQLTAHPDAQIADAAAALLVAGSRRIDRFGEPVLNRADLPIRLQHRVTWWVAAALREFLVTTHGVDHEQADRALVSATNALLASFDKSETVESRTYELAYCLRAAKALDDALLTELLREGELALVIAGVAVRARIDGATVWTMLADHDASRLTLVLRAIDMERSAALGLLADLSTARSGYGLQNDLQLTRAADTFESLSVEEARAAIRPWRLDDQYQRAIAGLAFPGEGSG